MTKKKVATNKKTSTSALLDGVVVDRTFFSLAELSRACGTHADWVISLVEEGIIEPYGNDTVQWRFSGVCLRRARSVRRLQKDLGVNLAGAALAIELMEELEQLRARLRLLEEF